MTENSRQETFESFIQNDESMRLSGRRESNHVEDRRGMGAGAKAGIGGIGGVILIALLTLLGGGDLGDVVNNVVTQEMQQSRMTEAQAPNQREFTEEEQELAKFSRQILAGTEDVWTEEFKKMGRQYVPPYQQCAECLWRRNFVGGTFLLFGRPKALYRPVLLFVDEKPTRS
jgi:hypothetical protein